MTIESLNEAIEILQKDTPLSQHKQNAGEDVSLNNVLACSQHLIQHTPFSKYIYNLILNEIGIPFDDVVKEGRIEELLGFQVFAGLTRPSFNTLIRICYGGYLSIDETQEAIRLAGYKPLNQNDPRDSILLNGLIFHKSINEINDDLYYLDPSLNLFLL